MGRRAERGMINLGRIFPKSAGRLYSNKHIAIHRARYQKLPIVFHHMTRRLIPILFQLVLHRLFKSVVKLTVLFSGNFVGFRQLPVVQHRTIVGSMTGKKLNKLFPVFRDKINLITSLLHIDQQAADTFHRIQPQTAADIRVFRRIVMEDNSHLFILIGDMPQRGPFPGFAHHMSDPFCNRKVTNIPIFQHFFRSNRYAVADTVKFRQGNRNGNLHRIHPVKGSFPFFVRRNQRISLDHRHIPFFKELYLQCAAAGQGKFGCIDKNIDHGNPVPKEKPVKYFRQGRHPQLLIRHSVGKDADHVHFLFFNFPYHEALVLQIPPDPFVTVKHKS